MHMKRSIFAVALGVASTALALGLGPIPAAAAAAVQTAPSSAAGSGSVHRGLPLAPHISAPYIDVTAVGDLATLSATSGSKYLTLAFLQTEAQGSCTVYWAGDTSKPVSVSTYGAQIAQIRKRGGDVIPSFGGYSADTTNTEIADSCTDVHKIAQAYERVITTYNVTRLDFDIEADSLSNPAGVDRRNKAILEVEKWAASHRRLVEIVYTLPSTPQGLAPSGLAVLQSAAKNRAPVAGVNIMTFDYWDGQTHDMVKDAETAATGLLAQMKQTIAPRSSNASLWRRIGVTQMNGIDDFGTEETLTVAQAGEFIAWASAHKLGAVSFWALQRDNGSCPGVKGSNVCSGVAQSDWAFSRAFAAFNSWWY